MPRHRHPLAVHVREGLGVVPEAELLKHGIARVVIAVFQKPVGEMGAAMPAEVGIVQIQGRFRNADGTYANDEMTANACAVYFGIDDSPALIDHLAAQLRANSHKADFGIIGAKTIPRVLAANGYAADAFKCFIQPEFPGWGNWIARGATSLWENWDGTGSQTHVMYGDFPAWCFNFLAGIRIMEPGFKSVMIAPADVPEAGNYTFSFRTPYGEITTERTGSTFRCHVPEAIKCTLAIPETMSAEKI